MIASKAKQMAPTIEVGQLMNKAGLNRTVWNRVANNPLFNKTGGVLFEIYVHVLRGYWASIKFLARNLH